MTTILFIDHALVVGGAQLVLVNYLKHINRDNLRVLVATSDVVNKATSGFERYADKVYRVQIGQLKSLNLKVLGRFVCSVSQIIQIIREERVDVVATNTERAMYVGTIASVITGRRLVWFIRDFCYNRILLMLLRVFPVKIICVSNSIKEYYLLKKAKVIHVSSDMRERLLNVEPAAVRSFKKRFGLNNKFVVGYIGRLVEWKGIKVLIDAIAKLNDPSVVCLLVGEKDKTWEDVRTQTNKIRKNVIYVGFRDDAENVLSALDVFVHPAIEPEPFATTIVEAMMAKVPVIATDLGGTNEIIRDKENGLLIKPNDSTSMVKAITLLKNNLSLRKRIGLNGYKDAIQENKIENEIKQLENIFESCQERSIWKRW